MSAEPATAIVPSYDPHDPYAIRNGVATRWLTKDKRSLLIAEMGDQHLQNTMRMLERKLAALTQRADAAFDAASCFVGEIYLASSGDEEAAVDELRYRIASAPILAGLRAELQRRGLPELPL
jgi:hypothetical protein